MGLQLSDVKLLLIAGCTGSGKSEFVRQCCKPEHCIVSICFDALMHDSIAFAFPYFVGGDKRWSKKIWEDTKDLIDAHSAMLRTIRHFKKYEQHANGTNKNWIFYGYQCADWHWIRIAMSLTRDLAGATPRKHVCWMHPPLETVISQRRKRDDGHDRVTDGDIAKQYNNYEQRITGAYDSKVVGHEEALGQFSDFFGISV